MGKSNVMTCTLSDWIGLIENLKIKRKVLDSELDDYIKGLNGNDKKEWAMVVEEITNIDLFTNKVNSILNENKHYRKIFSTLHQMAEEELDSIEKNTSLYMKEKSDNLIEHYSVELEIKFDKSINEYIGY